jgi:hypothetical protein
MIGSPVFFKNSIPAEWSRLSCLLFLTQPNSTRAQPISSVSKVLTTPSDFDNIKVSYFGLVEDFNFSSFPPCVATDTSNDLNAFPDSIKSF